MGIVVLGAVFVDIKGYPNTTYIPAGRNAGRVEQVHGGVSRNVAEDIANLELRPTFVSLVDDTGLGADVTNHLKSHKVNTDYLMEAPDGMGTWLAVFDHKGDVVASISKRPDLTRLDKLLDEKGDEIFSRADSIVLEFDMERPTVKRVLAYAEKYGKSVYAVISNMSIVLQKNRDLIRKTECFVCNQEEAGLLFSEDYEKLTVEQMAALLPRKLEEAQIPCMVVTMGSQGAVYARRGGECGICPPQKVNVKDTTGAGDAFCAGVSVGLTYGKTLREACTIGTRLAAAVIGTLESVCPRFMPKEFGLAAPVEQ